MLGVRRASVSEVAAELATENAIACHRGRITIVDRDRLETIACPCYRTIRDTFAAAYRDLR